MRNFILDSVLGCASSGTDMVWSWKDDSSYVSSRLTFSEILGAYDTVERRFYSHDRIIYLTVGLSASLYPALVMIWAYDR